MARGQELNLPKPDLIVCADWSKARKRRAAWSVDVLARSVSPLQPPVEGWTAGALLDATERLTADAALLAFDAPLGVPRSYFDAYQTRFGQFSSFSDWLAHALARSAFLVPVSRADDWTVERPFFHVPPGAGSLTAFVRAAEARGVDLKREVERRTHAKSVFAMGIPGHVAHAAQALWTELAAERVRGRRFAIWPFVAPEPGEPAVVEIYPSAAYRTVLDARLGGARGQQVVRRDTVERLAGLPWVAGAGVALDGLEQAQSNEDDFDAFMTALALLRLVLEGRPLALHVDSIAEGAILGETAAGDTPQLDPTRRRAWEGAALPARITFVTLACRDMERMARFYRQFGWPEAPSSEPVHVVFQCTNGVVLGLYGAEHYAPHVGPVADGFRGYTLAVNVENWSEIERAYETVRSFSDVQDLDAEPQRTEWGGGFSFRDPEGNVWDVAWAEGARFDERGGLIFP